MTRRLLIAAVFLSATVPALAQTPLASSPPAKPPCLQQINIYDYQPVEGNRSLVVIDRSRQRYRLNFMAACYNLQYHVGLRFKTFGSNLSCLARGDSVLLRDRAGPGQCIIKDIQYQTPAMDQADAAAALAKKKR
ncbi:MAG TPA: DUF6491 family protein [Rhizomicrobium sp.]|nr:DUF6491 family protein [Rhizomicrobium sp.]